MIDFRVASYNIRKCVGLDRQRDADRTLRVVASLDADVVMLQEADRRLPPRPSALPPDASSRLGMQALDVDPSTPSIGFHGNALLIRGPFRCIWLKGLDLPGLEPRGAIIAELERDGLQLRVVATHLGLLRRYRQLQLESISAEIASRPMMPTLIAGDFNEWSDSGGFGPLNGSRVISPGRTYHASRPVAPLDRFAIGQGIDVLSTSVVSAGEAARASDHLPIIGNFRLAAR